MSVEQRTARFYLIRAAVSDLVSDFIYYDRKEDDDLPRRSIEDAIAKGEITVDEIVAAFRVELNSVVHS